VGEQDRCGVDVWVCRGRAGDAFRRWHVTSDDLSEQSFPGLEALLATRYDQAVSFHGFGAQDAQPSRSRVGEAPLSSDRNPVGDPPAVPRPQPISPVVPNRRLTLGVARHGDYSCSVPGCRSAWTQESRRPAWILAPSSVSATNPGKGGTKALLVYDIAHSGADCDPSPVIGIPRPCPLYLDAVRRHRLANGLHPRAPGLS
jgi:hypothetical protein